MCQSKRVLKEPIIPTVVFTKRFLCFCGNSTGNLFAASALKRQLDRQKSRFSEEISAENNANLQCV